MEEAIKEDEGTMTLVVYILFLAMCAGMGILAGWAYLEQRKETL